MTIGVVSKSSAVTVKGPIEIPPPGHFDDLVVALKEALGPSSGLTSDDVEVKYLTRLMFDYDSRNGDWLKYAFGDASRGYTRNLVDEGNGKSNMADELGLHRVSNRGSDFAVSLHREVVHFSRHCSAS